MITTLRVAIMVTPYPHHTNVTPACDLQLHLLLQILCDLYVTPRLIQLLEYVIPPPPPVEPKIRALWC